ncbi:MAG: DUF1273 family protein [Oscillibacter sp.]|nr:DUF1273 family protein [Oscillibacter sp.]
MAARQESCSFTGHRPEKLPWGDNERDPRCEALRRSIADALELAYEEGFRHFICGMAQGCDLYFCEAAQKLKRTRPGVTIEAALPYVGFADRWASAQRVKYAELLRGCDNAVALSTVYTPYCALQRDRYLIDHASLLLAAYNGTPGGTRYTIEYALKRGVEVRYLPIEDAADAIAEENDAYEPPF